MEEWKTYKLGELLNIKYGKDHKSLSDGLFPAYGSGGIMRMVEKPIYDKPSILIPRKGSLNNIIYTDSPFWTVDTMFWTIIDNDIVLPHYLYYSIKDVDFASLNVGSAVPSLTCPIIEAIEVTIPSISIQQKILNCIEPIDEKISLNNRINHNLEEQAQALYKSWFVDFEPFKDGKFVESELGMIPEGWRVGCYNDIISSTVSGDWGKDREVGNYTHKVSCIRGCDFADVSSGIRGKTPERFILEKNFKNKRLLDKDIVVEISGGTPTVSTGRICLVSDNLLDKYSGNIVCTNFCRVIRPCSGYSSYVFYSWLDKYKSRVMFGYENGTSGIKNFQISDFMEKEPVIIPPQTVIAKFQTIVEFYQAVIQRNGNERMECETVRDTLLPKLMSGELKINDLTC